MAKELTQAEENAIVSLTGEVTLLLILAGFAPDNRMAIALRVIAKNCGAGPGYDTEEDIKREVHEQWKAAQNG